MNNLNGARRHSSINYKSEFGNANPKNKPETITDNKNTNLFKSELSNKTGQEIVKFENVDNKQSPEEMRLISLNKNQQKAYNKLRYSSGIKTPIEHDVEVYHKVCEQITNLEKKIKTANLLGSLTTNPLGGYRELNKRRDDLVTEKFNIIRKHGKQDESLTKAREQFSKKCQEVDNNDDERKKLIHKISSSAGIKIDERNISDRKSLEKALKQHGFTITDDNNGKISLTADRTSKEEWTLGSILAKKFIKTITSATNKVQIALRDYL